MSELEFNTLLAVGYGLVLLLIAYGIDRMARKAQTSLQEHRSGGFSYHEDHDAWLCPEDQWLWPQSFDPENRVMRYRGSPNVCNSCPVKDTCTSSDDGREMARMVDHWPASESARFHRGIACALTVLAVTWPIATAFTVDDWLSQVILVGATVLIVLGALPLWSHLRRTPADPHGVLVRSLDENIEERNAVIETVRRRRTSYASDRRETTDDAP